MGDIAFQIHEGALASVRYEPLTFTRAHRIAAAVKWYEQGRVSQGRGAEIAGLSRVEFLNVLSRYGVSPFQESIEDLATMLESKTP